MFRMIPRLIRNFEVILFLVLIIFGQVATALYHTPVHDTTFYPNIISGIILFSFVAFADAWSPRVCSLRFKQICIIGVLGVSLLGYWGECLFPRPFDGELQMIDLSFIREGLFIDLFEMAKGSTMSTLLFFSKMLVNTILSPQRAIFLKEKYENENETRNGCCCLTRRDRK